MLTRAHEIPPLVPSFESLLLSGQVDNVQHSSVLIVFAKSVLLLRLIIWKNDVLWVRLFSLLNGGD